MQARNCFNWVVMVQSTFFKCMAVVYEDYERAEHPWPAFSCIYKEYSHFHSAHLIIVIIKTQMQRQSECSPIKNSCSFMRL